MTYQIPDYVLFTEIDGETVLLNIQTGYYYAMNEVSTMIWQGIKNGQSRAAIQFRLRETYAVDSDQLQQDMDEFLAALTEHALVQEIS